MRKVFSPALVVVLVLGLSLTGCATKKWVDEQISDYGKVTATKISEVQGAVEVNQKEISDLAAKQAQLEKEGKGLALTDEACRGKDPNTKMHPPLRGAADVDACRRGLLDGTIDAIVTVCDGEALSTPCGGCRQKIREFSHPGTTIHAAGPEGIRAVYSMSELLPDSFGPENLGR